MKRSSNIHFSSTVSMSLVLFLIGLVSLLLFVAHDMSVYVKENINLSIILNDGTGKQEVERIEAFLSSSDYAKSMNYVSKQDALKEHVAALGDDPSDFLGFNPLRASLEVKLKAEYANPDSVKMIEEKLKSFREIERVAFQKDLISLVNENVRKISFVLLGLAVVLLIVAVALINNTVRLSVYSNRFSINTMQLVGATNWFIRKPYVKRAALDGVVASLLSLVIMAIVLYYTLYEFGLSIAALNLFSLFCVSVIVVMSGVIIMALSTYFSIGRYLKMNSNDIYIN